MNVELIHAQPTVDGSEGLLATVVKYRADWLGRVGFATLAENQLQVGYLKHPAGHHVPRHRHPPQTRVVRRTEEALVVLKGRVKVTLYNSEGKFEAVRELAYGDCVVFHGGAHSLEVSEDCEIVEVKQGPYKEGRDKEVF